MWADFIFENLNQAVKSLNKLLKVNIIQKLEEDANDGFEAGSDEFNCRFVLQEVDECNGRIDAHRQIFVLQVLVQIVQHVSQVVLVDRELSVLTIYPACTSSEEWVVGLEFVEGELLQHTVDGLAQLTSLCHVIAKQTNTVQECLSLSQILEWLLQSLHHHLHVASQIS